jgi:hypothetical protein
VGLLEQRLDNSGAINCPGKRERLAVEVVEIVLHENQNDYVRIESQALYLEQLDFGKRAVRADAEVEDLGRSVAVEIFEPLGGPERNNRIPAYARMTDPVFAAETDYPQSA